MKPKNNQLPDPEFPENQLIREAAVLPELSAGLRERVLTECALQFRIARRRRLIRGTTAVAAVFCALFGIIRSLSLPSDSLPNTSPVTPAKNMQMTTPDDRPPYPSINDAEAESLATGQQNLRIPEKQRSEENRQEPTNQLMLQESDQIRILIDTLQQRDRKLGAVISSFSL